MARGDGLRVARIFGIPIYLHSSWFLIFILYTLLLTTRSAMLSPEWTTAERWAMALGTSVLFFGSVLFHELAHSVMALRYKIPVASITLFVFGGVARITREPARAMQEFLIAVAGPLSSYVLWGAFGLAALATTPGTIVHEGTSWLSVINFWLATFNLIPGFPLDGGRILRSIVWALGRDFTRATQVAARSGQAIAYVMMALGLGGALFGRSAGFGFFEGIWLAFIGWFLLTMARQSYAQAGLQSTLGSLTAADLMTAETPTVTRDLSLEEYGEEVARTKHRVHLVMADGQLAGVMTMDALKAVPRSEWAGTSVQAAMLPREKLAWTTVEEPALSLMERMRQNNLHEVAVVEQDHVLGLVTMESVAQALQIRTELAGKK
jgi:Zn-dependent protease/predicted transcriptional regulator